MKRSAQTRLSGNLRDFENLAPYMARIAKGTLTRHSLYSLCVKASVSKCFEFNLAAPGLAKSNGAFFAMASLRGICEDLIVLRYVGGLPTKDRQQLIHALSRHELASRLRLQDAFFSAIRPQQPVLRLKDPKAAMASSEAAARAVWNRHGWPNMQRGTMPAVREIAEKQGLHQLAVLYDYFYRLTSASVHFSVQSLLRSGWGRNLKNVVFSTKGFAPYFADYCSLYGAFMFCLYFEFFGSVLRPGSNERAVVDSIRRNVLFARRWPEMVTYEEMNLKPPADGEAMRMIMSALQASARKRLIAPGIDYGNKRSAERRLVAGAIDALVAANAGRRQAFMWAMKKAPPWRPVEKPGLARPL